MTFLAKLIPESRVYAQLTVSRPTEHTLASEGRKRQMFVGHGPEAQPVAAWNAAHRGVSLCGPLRGEMRLQEYLHASRTVAFRPSFASTQKPFRARNRLPGLAIALFLLPFGGRALFAQAPPEPDANMDQPYNPNAQFDSGQQSYSAQSQPYPQQAYSASPAYPQQPAYGQAQALSADQLQQLVSPIALYPDQLIALILAASTYPAQVADADRWRQAQSYASPDQIAAGANLQNWDPSVKALMAFPQVLSEEDANLAWTTALGNAYYNQPQDVLQAVQIMRQRAQAAGSLQSTPQQLVSYNQGYIQVAPANPQVVYVPAYNPWRVYGQPISPYPGFSLFGALGSFLNSSTLRFGLGMAMSAFSHTPWGWLGWGLNWLTQNVLFNQSNYSSNSTSVADWGLPHGGPRYFHSGYGQPGRGYTPAPAQGYLRSQSMYANNWSRENYNHGYQAPEFGNTRPPLQTWNHSPTPVSRPQNYTQSYTQNYSRPSYRRNDSYGAGYAARPGQSYGGSLQAYNRNPVPVSRPQNYTQNYTRSYAQNYSRPAQTYGSSYPAYRSPTTDFQRGNYGQRSSSAFTGSSFMSASAKPQHSGGFHPFGSGHSSDNPYGGGHGFKEPKQFKEPKNLGGGHSGGFHPFGGGHSSSGGHFGGHGGGGHHRL